MTRASEIPDGVAPRTAPADLTEWEVPHPNPFVCDITITPEQLSGTIAHVSNIQYVRWLDRAAELHADSLGYTRSRLLEAGRMWFVARHEIDYLAEAWPDDRLLLATWVRDMRRVKSWREYLVARPVDGQVICRAATLWVLVDLESRRPVRVPAEMSAAFEPLHLDPVRAAGNGRSRSQDPGAGSGQSGG